MNSLSLSTCKMRPDKPLLGTKDEQPSFTREIFQMKWRAGDALDLYVLRPRGVAKPPVALFLYTYPYDTDRFKDNGFAERATRGGVAAVGFVSALTGHRYHYRPMKQWFVSELQESLVTSVHDVQMILNYLYTRGDLNMDRVGMFGTGSGGTIAILAAAVDPRIKAVDVLDPWADWPDWMAQSSAIPENERPGFVKPEFLKRAAPFDPVQWLPKVGARSIRIQHVMDDTITPKLCKQRLEAAAPPSVQIAHYDTTRAMSDKVSGRVFDWIKAQLTETPKPSAQQAAGSGSKTSGARQ